MPFFFLLSFCLKCINFPPAPRVNNKILKTTTNKECAGHHLCHCLGFYVLFFHCSKLFYQIQIVKHSQQRYTLCLGQFQELWRKEGEKTVILVLLLHWKQHGDTNYKRGPGEMVRVSRVDPFCGQIVQLPRQNWKNNSSGAH